jgi:hypothetical protein
MAFSVRIIGGGFYKNGTSIAGKIVKLVKVYENVAGGEVLWEGPDTSGGVSIKLSGATGTNIGTAPRHFSVGNESGFNYLIDIKGGSMTFGSSYATISYTGLSGTVTVNAMGNSKNYTLSQYQYSNMVVVLEDDSMEIPSLDENEHEPYGIDDL